MNSLECLTKELTGSVLLIGYYGGTNFGDELLLEVAQVALSASKKITHIDIIYTKPKLFQTYHQNYGARVTRGSAINFIQKLIRTENIIIGGGGHWGMDHNQKVLFLSIALFIARVFLLKKVYLIGVGYYNSTSILGRISASIAGMTANAIFARDKETYENFSRFRSKLHLDTDLVQYLPKLFEKMTKIPNIDIQVSSEVRYIFISYRRLKHVVNKNYLGTISKLVEQNEELHFIICPLEAKEMETNLYTRWLRSLAKYKNVTFLEFDFNPVSLYKFFTAHRAHIKVISPQYHGQMVAHLAGVLFFPIYYDNKNIQFLHSCGIDNPINIQNIDVDELDTFVKSH